MSLINISSDDIKRGLPWPDSWFKAEIESTEVRESGDKKTVHYIPTYKIVEHPDPNLNGRLLGGMGATNFNTAAIGMMVPFIAALENMHIAEFREKFKKEGIQFEFQGCKGRKLQIKVKNTPFEERMIPKVVDFLPFDDKIPF